MHQKCTRRASSLAAPACHQRKRWTQTGATLCLQRTPARLLRKSHQGLSWPRKATQDATGEELAAAWPWNFERASLWAPVLKWGCLAKKTFPALKSFVCYKPWRAVLEAPDGHETNFWQPEKFILVDLESICFHYTAASFYTNLTQPPAWIIKINFPALQKFYSMGPCHLHVRKLPILLKFSISNLVTDLVNSL